MINSRFEITSSGPSCSLLILSDTVPISCITIIIVAIIFRTLPLSLLHILDVISASVLIRTRGCPVLSLKHAGREGNPAEARRPSPTC